MITENMCIGVVGAEALGSIFGAKVAESGLDIVLIDKWIDHVSAINNDGLCVHTSGGDKLVTRQTATTDTNGVDPVDVLFLMVKTNATVAALEAASPVIDTETIVTSFQTNSPHKNDV